MLSKVLPNAYLGEPPSKWLVMHALRSGTLVWRPPAPLTTAPKARSPTQCYNPQQNRNDWARVSKIHGFWGAVMAKRKKATGKTNATMHRSKTGVLTSPLGQKRTSVSVTVDDIFDSP